jgi:hypothetical protein
MCAVDMVEHRRNSWELYGFDFMIDENFRPWLIEINSSPACDYSTTVTEKYVQKALVEILAVVLDLRKWEATPKKERGDKPSTGGWQCIYRGPMLEKPFASLGSDMTLKGEACRLPRAHQSLPASSRKAVDVIGSKPKIMMPSVHPNQSSPTNAATEETANYDFKRRREVPARRVSLPLATDSSNALQGMVSESDHEMQSQSLVMSARTRAKNESAMGSMNDSDDDEDFDTDASSTRRDERYNSTVRVQDSGIGVDKASKLNGKQRLRSGVTGSAYPAPANKEAIPLKTFQVDF